MKVDYNRYYEIYHDSNDKFFDAFQSEEGLKSLPFVSNGTSIFDKECGLLGITGEFFRKWKQTETRPINNFKEDVEIPVSAYLKDERNMPEECVKEFLVMLKDILYVNGNLNITEPTFLKYLPLIPDDENIAASKNKYKKGQESLANYLYSMVTDEIQKDYTQSTPNLFTSILKEALEQGSKLRDFKDLESSGTFYIYEYIKKMFKEDMNWLLKQEEPVIVKYMPLMLYFYTCYSITQTILGLSPKVATQPEKPEPFYFILSSEKASLNSEAVQRGWKLKVPKTLTTRLYGKLQAVHIANCVLGGNIGLYPEILKKLKETPFEENKEACEKILSNYQHDKIILLNKRKTEVNQGKQPIDSTVNSYEEFLKKLHTVCTSLQSGRYDSRIEKQLFPLMNVRFLQLRRGNYVLTIDNEMLIFLVAMVTKGEKTKLENMYRAFNDYGIYFNLSTRAAIEELLLKLNLLDRKSDSGEAQYVTVVL